MEAKSLHYAYPTSEWAQKYNNNKGCWLIFTHPNQKEWDKCNWIHNYTFQDSEKERAYKAFKEIRKPLHISSFTE